VYHNYVFDNASQALPVLVRDVLDKGEEHGSRAGLTKELTHVGITLKSPWRREILVPHRNPSIAAQIAETVWVLSGSDDIRWLANYLPRAWDFSDDGETWRAGYGRRLRSWAGLDTTVDQLDYVVRTLQESPMSRQAVMNIWSPTVDTNPGKDIPCNNWLSFSSRLGELDLMVGIRSNDVVWGWSGINAFEWSALQEIVAGLLGVTPGGLHFATTSFHLYGHHFAKAERMAAHPLEHFHPVDSPRFDASKLASRDVEGLDGALSRFLRIEHDIRNGVPGTEVDVEAFPEPMLQSWLRVLQWWWSGGDESFLIPLGECRLRHATLMSVQPTVDTRVPEGETQTLETIFAQADSRPADPSSDEASAFLLEVFALHREKHEAYGDSWKRRGEMLGIMANIARKVDRLGGAETADESSVDTAMDLMVYLAKYRTWLEEQTTGLPLSDDPEYAHGELIEVERGWLFSNEPTVPVAALEQSLRDMFDRLEQAVVARDHRRQIVDEMLSDAYVLARTLWRQANDA
jgi:thymidylate synthase